MSQIKGFILTLLIALLLVIAVPSVKAASQFDTVSERINGDLTQIGSFIEYTNNPSFTEEQFLKNMNDLDIRLRNSKDLYNDLGTISDPALKVIEPEMKDIIRDIDGVHAAIIDLRKGYLTQDKDLYMAGADKMDKSLIHIDATITKLEEKAKKEENKDKQTEILYIAGTLATVALAIALFLRSKRPQINEVAKQKAEAYTQLFRQSLAPAAGFIITLASFEYAKYTQSTSYTIFTGLLVVGVIYFAIAAGKYMFQVRPQLQKLS